MPRRASFGSYNSTHFLYKYDEVNGMYISVCALSQSAAMAALASYTEVLSLQCHVVSCAAVIRAAIVIRALVEHSVAESTTPEQLDRLVWPTRPDFSSRLIAA